MYIYNLGLAYREIATAYNTSPALKLDDGTISHGELDRLANRIAAIFMNRGIGRRDVVAIAHDKSVECYGSMIAALKLGAAYVNLDDQNPAPRMAHILSSCRPKVIVACGVSRSIAETAATFQITLVDFKQPAIRSELEAAPSVDPPGVSLVTAADPAYIMFTSGSTGVPKGAIMTHANVLNFSSWSGERFNITARDVLSNVNPMYFDNSVFDFYAALLNGAAIAPIPRSILEEPAAMLARLEDAGCTLWFSVPSLLIYLTTLKMLTADRLQAVRAFIFGGEGYPKPELKKLFAMFSGRSKLVNVYGPTECTCICSAWDVGERDLADSIGLVTLGPLAANFFGLVLDEDDTAVAEGDVGELCLLGPQVGLGYVNDAQRTAKSFVPNPLNGAWTERMYRTGDLVRLGRDGKRLDFVGRKDNQVKHMGYRIELEEIEAALSQIPGVVQCAVVQKTGARGFKQIVAYVSGEGTLPEPDLRTRLGNLLPPYMIPQHFQHRRELPKNANGKIDRIALAAEP